MPDGFTDDQKRAAVERELHYRRRVYPRLISEGKMSERLAQRQIAIFEAIAVDYEENEWDRLL